LPGFAGAGGFRPAGRALPRGFGDAGRDDAGRGDAEPGDGGPGDAARANVVSSVAAPSSVRIKRIIVVTCVPSP
jgi:hypothetical protein